MTHQSGFQGGGPKDVRSLLFRSGVVDVPPEGARERTLAALGLGAGVAPAVNAARGAWRATWIKWSIGVGLSALFLAGGYRLTHRTPSHDVEALAPNPTQAMERVNVDSLPAVAEVAAAGRADEIGPVAEPPRALEPGVSKPRPSGSTDTTETLAEEMRLIEAARQDLQTLGGAAALRQLDEYKRRFPQGRLGPEAIVLRTEALIAEGDREAAVRLATSFLRSHPNSPYKSRLHGLLGTGARGQ
jgi:hypothetical protein